MKPVMIRLPKEITDVYETRKEITGISYASQAMAAIYKYEVEQGTISPVKKKD